MFRWPTGASSSAANNPASTSLSSDVYNFAFKGDLKALKSALDRGADVNSSTLARFRSSGGSLRLQSLFCVQAATPLFIASLKGHTDCVRLLLEHGADVAARKNVRCAMFLAGPWPDGQVRRMATHPSTALPRTVMPTACACC